MMVIRSNVTISTFETNKISRFFSAFCLFFSRRDFYYRRRISICTENQTRGFSFYSCQICPNYLPQLNAHGFPKPRAFLLRIISCYLIINICIYWFLSLHFLPLWNWNTSIGAVYTFDSLFFGIISVFLLLLLFYVIKIFSDKQRFPIFRKWIFSWYFRYSTVLTKLRKK